MICRTPTLELAKEIDKLFNLNNYFDSYKERIAYAGGAEYLCLFLSNSGWGKETDYDGYGPIINPEDILEYMQTKTYEIY